MFSLFQDRIEENYYESLRRTITATTPYSNNPFVEITGSTRHPAVVTGSNPDGALSSSGVWTGSEQDKEDTQQAENQLNEVHS